MKKFLLSVLSVFFALPMFAQQISVDEATNSALQFFGNGTRAKAGVELAYTSAQDGKNHFFVFNSAVKDGGFVIVGADKAAYEILGYSDSGSFDYSQIPENMKWWLNQYDLQIAEGIRQGVDSRKVTRGTRAERSSIEPLIETQWNQDAPYNKSIPSLGGEYKNFVTGCVATAMAQIMKYHQWPTIGTGSNNYTITYNSTMPIDFNANFGSTTYDWSNMIDNYSSSYTDEQANAVSTLMYHCGVAVNMQYNTSASSASLSNVPSALVNYFNYDKSMQYLKKDYFNDYDWEDVVYSELEQNRPILYGGESSIEGNKGGHAFVCDGYNTERFHINWGWGGYSDGYYSLTGTTALDPNDSGIGGAGSAAQYKDSQEIVIGIKKDEGGNYAGILSWNSPGLSSTSIEEGSKLNFVGTFFNLSGFNLSFDIGAKLTNISTNEDTYIIIGSNISINNNTGYDCSYFPIDIKGIAPGNYKVRPVSRVVGGEWNNVNYKGEEKTIIVTESTNDYVLTSKPTVGNGDYAIGTMSELKIKFKVLNKKNYDLENKVFTLSVFCGTTNVSQNSTTITIPANKEIEVIVPSSYVWYNVSAGSSCSYGWNLGSDPINAEYSFNVVDAKDISYSLSTSGIGTIILPFEAEIPDGFKVYECTSINEQTLVLTEASKIAQFTPYIINGTANASTSFNGPDVPPAKATYTKGLLKGVVDTYNLQSDDYILQTQDGTTAFYKVGDGAANGKAATKYRCTLNLPTSLSSTLTSVGFPAGIGTTAIDEVFENAVSDVVGIYSIDGKQQSTLQKGLNILRKADGSAVKVIVK